MESELKLNDVFEFIGVITLGTEPKVDKNEDDEFSNGLSEDLSVQFPPDTVLMHFELFHHFLHLILKNELNRFNTLHFLSTPCPDYRVKNSFMISKTEYLSKLKHFSVVRLD